MAAASQSASNGRRATREGLGGRSGLLDLLSGRKRLSARRAGDHDALDASDCYEKDGSLKHVDMAGWHLDLEAGMLRGRSYRRQRIVLTRAVIAVGGAFVLACFSARAFSSRCSACRAQRNVAAAAV